MVLCAEIDVVAERRYETFWIGIVLLKSKDGKNSKMYAKRIKHQEKDGLLL